MVPLDTCWNWASPGGEMRETTVVYRERKTNNTWNKFTRHKDHRKLTRYILSTQ